MTWPHELRVTITNTDVSTTTPLRSVPTGLRLSPHESNCSSKSLSLGRLSTTFEITRRSPVASTSRENCYFDVQASRRRRDVQRFQTSCLICLLERLSTTFFSTRVGFASRRLRKHPVKMTSWMVSPSRDATFQPRICIFDICCSRVRFSARCCRKEGHR